MTPGELDAIEETRRHLARIHGPATDYAVGRLVNVQVPTLIAEVRRLQAQPMPDTDPQGAAVEALVAERDAARAEVVSLRAERDALLAIALEARPCARHCLDGPLVASIDAALARASGDTREEAAHAPAGSRPGPQG